MGDDRSLQRAPQKLMDETGGLVPSSFDDIEALPLYPSRREGRMELCDELCPDSESLQMQIEREVMPKCRPASPAGASWTNTGDN